MASSPPASKRPKTEQTSLTNFFQLKNPPRNETSGGKEKETDEEKQVTADDSNAKVDDEPDEKNDSQIGNCEPIIPESSPPVGRPRHSWQTLKGACIYRKVAREEPRAKVAAFDLDNTLLEWRITGWPSRMEHYELWNASVITKLQKLHDDGYKLVIFSNQGAIRGALDGKKSIHVKSLLDWLARTLDRPLFAVLSTKSKDDNEFHKPSPNMWFVAEEYCNGRQEFDVENSFFCGDSVGGEDDAQGGKDIGFAKNVSERKGKTLKFYTPKEFFGPSNKEMRERAQFLGGEYEEPSAEVLTTRAALTSGYLQGPIMLILCGVQGSGKSTFCERLLEENANRWVHLAQDTINGGKSGKREKVEEAAKEALQKNRSVVIDRMNLDETQRSYFLEVTKSAGVPAHAVALLPEQDVVLKRVRERDNHPGGVEGEKGVKIAARSKLEMPKYSEGFALISAAGTVEGAARILNLYRNVTVAPVATLLPTSFQIDDKVSLPSIALGTAKLGSAVTTDIVSRALNSGFTAVDTAPTYKNEDKVGEAIKEDTFCIIKVPKRATSRDQVVKEFEDSLSSLKRKHADLLLLHWPSDVIAANTIKQVWETMENLKKDGRTIAIGVCNFNVQALRVLLSCCIIPPAVNQVERHPLLSQFELLDFCAKHDILLQAHSPLGQGSDELLDHPIVKGIATNTGLTPAQVVLKWNLQQGVAIAVKCSSDEHIGQALAVQSSKGLSAQQMKALNEVKESKRFVDPPFMYGTAPYCWGKQRPLGSK